MPDAKRATRKRIVKPKRPAPRAEAQRALELALASFAHDIRTPLTGILALAELIAASDLPPRERGWAQAIKNAAEYLGQLSTLAIDSAKAGAAGLVLRQDIFDLRRLLDMLGTSLAARAGTHGLSSEIKIAGAVPEQLIGDAARLRAAVENLIDNAVKFTEAGSVRLAIAAKAVRRGKVRLSVAVTDSGIGLSPAEIKRLFKPFAQGSAQVGRRFGGSGLGLSMVKRIAKAMGGDLTVTSRAGRGSTFTLSAVFGAVAKAAPDHPTSRGLPRARRLKVLCVEDNPYGRVILNTLLTELGHTAEFAASGEAAIETLRHGRFDLVLMDLALPGIDGLETARRVRALRGAAGRVPIVGVSGHDDGEAARDAAAAGMARYLTKPISPAKLAGALAEIAKR